MATVHVAVAQPGELDLAFALLPHVANQGVAAESVLLARRAGDHAIVGAAAFSSIPWEVRRSGLRGAIFVLPSQRRRGVGGALLTALGAMLRQWDVDYLHAWGEWDDIDAPPFLARKGFTPQRALLHYQVDTRNACRQTSLMLERLRVGRRIPAGAAAMPLAPRHLPQAITLYSSYARLPLGAAAARFEAALADPACAVLSQVVELDGELIGLLLCKPNQELPEVDLWITQPGHRHGWPALLLLDAPARQLATLARPRFRFSCNDAASATLQIARRTDATLLHTTHTYALAL
ncbi:GNAT family N-acetyltransferase [Duganella violaceipulchra]|uniref:GNAT family N-acetyltransferase n=1 Tax=Duganella violaceipulchra TaxID=2849652 RepID=A0AA41L2U4_9BURK|nr:GNAT family N-acetyltransferase [Duganella violaceicalia]MBV6320859.1 GNAT family N-acetyltransferase [Duganella violaceicalia]MCP2008430.1 GNAT superfamily N-acetyltransferase [Duganella violaceicalia]